jgi:hypothetical protein
LKRYSPNTESEDERIRKELISHFNSYKANCSSDWYGIKVNSIIAWLENQERTMHTKNSDDFIVKSEGLDEVEKYILSLVPLRSLDAIKVDAKNLRFLVEKEQKPTEWSEEDLQMLQDVISGLEATKQLTYAHEPQGKAQMQEKIDWLKSLRPQNTWKPSEEHFELEEFAKIVRGNLTGISKVVQKLFEAKYLQLTGKKMYGGFKD